MIGKFDKKRKEQKALLKELESIKELLDSGELIDDDFSDLAATAMEKTNAYNKTEQLINDADNELTKDANSGLTEKADSGLIDNTDSELINDSEEDDFLISDDLDIDLSETDSESEDIPILEEMVSVGASTSLAPGALPGQKSLFDDSKNSNSGSSTPEEDIKKNADAFASAMSKSLKENKPKEVYSPPKVKSGDNPFLPKHIRDRLSGNIDEPAFAESLTSSDDTKSAKVSNSPEFPIDRNEMDDIINTLVAEYMPKIETQLREKLALVLLQKPKK